MHHKLVRAHSHIFTWRNIFSEEFLALFLVAVVFVSPVAAATRFQDRGLIMQNASPGATTSYTLKFSYVTPAAVGSVDMLFCDDPIPYNPCVAPAGLDVSGAVLSSQSGETNFTIGTVTSNHIVLTRPPSPIFSNASTYKFDNIVNPTTTNKAFSIRLRSHATTDATGPQINFGSVRGQVTTDITLETQVPPMLIFCVAGEVEDNCEDTSGINYSDMGQLSAQSTLQAQSQMAVGTNASGGFAITANGDPLSAGTNVIDAPTVPTVSQPGTNQFGINLVANNAPSVGSDPEGTWQNAIPSPGYGVPNQFKYVPGDVVAFSPDVSLMKKFTVSYIVNSSENLRAGVYTTTITYIASGRF